MIRPSRRPSAQAMSLAAAFLFLAAASLPAVAEPAQPASAASRPEAPQLKVEGAWIRAAVKGQSGTGGYMRLTASQPLTLLGFTSSVAGESELHEMAMEGNVMRMRPVTLLALPAGQAVDLRPGPGGRHLMLMDLKRELKEGDEVVLTLKLRTTGGQILKQDVTVPVRLGQMNRAGMPHDGH